MSFNRIKNPLKIIYLLDILYINIIIREYFTKPHYLNGFSSFIKSIIHAGNTFYTGIEKNNYPLETLYCTNIKIIYL